MIGTTNQLTSFLVEGREFLFEGTWKKDKLMKHRKSFHTT